MTDILIADLIIAKTGRSKGKSRLWRSLKEDMSVLVPIKAHIVAQVHRKRACFSSCKSCRSYKKKLRRQRKLSLHQLRTRGHIDSEEPLIPSTMKL
eukprot:609298-Pelagomonas_calceolata.AAC.1